MYPKEYIHYLVHFHGDRDYFECHEILEEYWKKTDEGNKDSIWVGFIQLAVSCYHHRRGNFNGAKKTLIKALEVFVKTEQTLSNLGLNPELLILLLRNRLSIIEQKRTYESFNLPFYSHSLLTQCRTECSQQGFIWCSSSDMKNKDIVHRHMSRDRTGIIKERNRALTNKKGSE